MYYDRYMKTSQVWAVVSVAILLIGGGMYAYVVHTKQSNQPVAVSPSARTSITVVSPAGKETFKVGDQITVSFSAAQTGGNRYRIDLFSTFMAGDAFVYNLGTTTGQTGGLTSAVFSIPSDAVVQDNYRIRITQLTDQDLPCVNYLDCAQAESNYFVVQ